MADQHIELKIGSGQFGQVEHQSDWWQLQAMQKLIESLKVTGQFAQKYRITRKERRNYLQAVHDAIFVSAPRGAGKTVFLRSACKIWEASKNTDVRLYFCPEVDPTLLVDNDNFANVVTAHLFNQIDCVLRQEPSNEKKSAFYSALERLGGALGNAEHADDDAAGIDRIINYRSGIQLESYFHTYVEACIDILGVDAIVLPIDDVDMALDRAFEVLDVVRRLLGCPYIIPMVSGDKALFEPIIVDHFLHGGSHKNSRQLLRASDARNLTDAYLTKLFPVQFRVGLAPLAELIADMRIVEEDHKHQISVVEYFEQLEAQACPFVNGEEKSRSWPYPVTAREMAQLCDLFPPGFLRSVSANKKDFWFRYQSLAEAKYHSSAYLTALGERHIVGPRVSGRAFRLSELEAFNPVMQARPERGEWNEKPYFAELDAAIASLRLSPPIEQSQRHFIRVFHDRQFILRSMPPLEFFTDRLKIPKFRAQLRTCGLASGQRFFFDVYCHHAVYGTSRRTSAQIFFGRAFEILAQSLLLANPLSRTKDGRIGYWDGQLSRIIAAPPFFSVYSLAPTKTLDDESDVGSEEDGDDEEEGRVTVGTYEAQRSRQAFARKICEWELRYQDILIEAQRAGLMNLLSCVFNKTFTQLHLMRTKATAIFVDDKLTDVMRRFEYVLINAFASFLNPVVVLQNTAHTPNLDLLRNPVEFGRKDPSFRENVVRYIGNRDAHDNAKGDLDSQQELLRAIWQHPLFSLADGDPLLDLQDPGGKSDKVGTKAQTSAKVAVRLSPAAQLRLVMPSNRKAAIALPQAEAKRIIKVMEDICRELGTSLIEVYAGRVNGKALYQAVRWVAAGKP